jgi:hypothetical protein
LPRTPMRSRHGAAGGAEAPRRADRRRDGAGVQLRPYLA